MFEKIMTESVKDERHRAMEKLIDSDIDCKSHKALVLLARVFSFLQAPLYVNTCLDTINSE